MNIKGFPAWWLKVLPQVDFKFRFNLKNTEINGITISAEDKIKLFRKILLDFGIGAKTNVGYGQFTQSQTEIEEDKKNERIAEQQKIIEDIKKKEVAEKQKKQLVEQKRKDDIEKSEAKRKEDKLKKQEETKKNGIKMLLDLSKMKDLSSKIRTWTNNYYGISYKKCLKDENLKTKLIPVEYHLEFIALIDKIYEKERTNKNWTKKLEKNQHYKLLTFCIGNKAKKWFNK